MNKVTLFFIINIVLLILIKHAGAVQKIKISTSHYNSDDYLSFTQSIPCYQQTSYKKYISVHRGAIDLHLICQAFKAANFPIDFEFVDAKDYKRSIVLVENGTTDMIAETVWENHLNDKLLASSPIYEKNEYELGLYTNQKNAENFKIETLADLQKLTGVSRRTWLNDWELLTKLNLKAAYSVDHIEQMFKMVKYGRADFLLWPFYYHTDDLAHEILHVDDQDLKYLKLFPVKNVKLTIPYSRHYVISTEATNAKGLLKALNDGIKKLKQQGRIKKLYKDSAFMSDKLADWLIIKPE